MLKILTVKQLVEEGDWFVLVVSMLTLRFFFNKQREIDKFRGKNLAKDARCHQGLLYDMQTLLFT